MSLRIDSQFNRIPDDSDASIQTAGCWAENTSASARAARIPILKDGGRIELTQSAMVLENLINKLFASFVSKDSSGGQPVGAGSEKDR